VPDPEFTQTWPVVRVSSHAQIEVPADRASLSIGLSSGARAVRIEAIAEVNTSREAVQAVLNSFEEAIQQVAVGRNSVYEVNQPNGDRASWTTAPQWEASVSFHVEIVDVTAIPPLYNRLRRLAPEGLGGPYWSLSEDHPAHNQARAAAVRSAVLRAREMAAAADTEVVALDWLADSDAEEVSMMAKGMMLGSAGEGDPFGSDLELEPALQTVSASVRAQYRVRPVTYGD
jgi:uncharacterized protein YggE